MTNVAVKDLSKKKRRTTVVLPEILARNVAIICGKRNTSLNKYLGELIKRDLEQNGLKPDALPLDSVRLT